jgi:Mrp family chromosome partitioning ATPase
MRRFAIRNFADERRQARPGSVVLVVPTSLAAVDVERAKDLVSIGNRRILGVISFGKKSNGQVPAPAREPVRVIGGSRPFRSSIGEA